MAELHTVHIDFILVNTFQGSSVFTYILYSSLHYISSFAVNKFTESSSSATSLGTTLQTIKSAAATQLSNSIPSDGQFAPHWGADAISGVLNVVGDNSREVLHQIVNELIQKLGSNGL